MATLKPEPLSELVSAVGPPIARSSAYVGAATGAAGLAIGGVAGTIRSSTPVLFSIVTGVQCSLLGSLYAFNRQTSAVLLARQNGVQVCDLSTWEKVWLSTGSGAMTGGPLAMLFRGRGNVVPAMLVYSSAGFLGQHIVNYIERRRARPVVASESVPIIERIKNHKWNPVKKMTDAEYKVVLEERLLRIEADIAVIDDNIAKLESEAISTTASTSKDPRDG